MLNPSVGNETYDDKTIKRLIFFTKKFGYGGFYVGNIFPNINTKVKDLYLDLSHDKKKNREHVSSMIDKSESIVYAWGNTIDNPPDWIDKIVNKPLCFGFNKNGTPKGNKWSFDQENRKKLPKDIKLPKQLKYEDTNHTKKLNVQTYCIFI